MGQEILEAWQEKKFTKKDANMQLLFHVQEINSSYDIPPYQINCKFTQSEDFQEGKVAKYKSKSLLGPLFTV